ncbi:PepSY domain-containing protein [Streptomyces sp. NBC_01261]|uniref:PepSY domain-containing protein n=1 Tax=Streptomyces sp. NBC_01261 TaxID=2903802 RepID=UPI002E2F9554|nr:PepSY domain-containing protein [Streptomyces sp. NBC_01261]
MMNASQGSPTGRRRTVAAVLAATAVLGGAGAVTAVAVADDGGRHGTSPGTSGTRHPEGADDSPSPSRRSTVTGTAIGLVRATDAGVASLPGTVTAVELDEHRGRTVWKVEIVAAGGDRHEVTVDTADGTVVGSRPDDDGEAALARSARTGLAAAVRSALTRVPGTATSVEVDDMGRSAVWEVEIAGADGTGHEVTVAAASGKVTAVRADDVDHHGRSTDGTDDDRGRHGSDDDLTGRTTDDDGARHSTPEDRPDRHADEDTPSRHGTDDGSGHGRGRGSDDESGHGGGHGSDDA